MKEVWAFLRKSFTGDCFSQ